MDMIRLSVPGTLRYRDVVLRVVASACKLMRAMSAAKQEASRDDDFDDKVVSAVGEAFNNVAIHAYRDLSPGAVELTFELDVDGITIHMSDTGKGFEPKTEKLPDLATLPESHMGLYIVRSFMDQVTYRPGNGAGSANVLTLSKRFAPAAE
jgi:serine/threonine-protein kinase RsbW